MPDTASFTLPKVKLRFGSQELSEGSGGFYDHINPATGKVQARIPMAGKAEMDAAVEAAAEAFKTWRNWKPGDRRDVLMKLASLIEKHGTEFAQLTAYDVGSAMSLGVRGWGQAKEWTSYYAGWCDKLEGKTTAFATREGEFRYSLAEPYGVIGIIITWNGPLIGMGMKIPPALAAGNTVVVKPSEMNAHVADLFARLCKEAGMPDGVVNMLPGGVEAGEALVSHPKVEKISFTGGPVTASKILQSCAKTLKPAVLELGGKSANIVFPDANLDEVCPYSAMWSMGLLSGQGCALPTRLLVHEDIYDSVIEKVVTAAKNIRQGDPFDMTNVMGPVVNLAAVNRILGMIERAQTNGDGKLVTGGKRRGGDLADGYFIEPTVFIDVDPASEIAQNEVFGPVLCIMKFKTEDEAIEIANSTLYGLAAYIQTADAKRFQRMSEQLRAGTVMINGGANMSPATPFGGLGVSGYGKEGGKEGIDEFIRMKTVAIGRF